jgi:LysR family transcriptional regulator, transcriptional activator of the cysJI operon
VVAYIENTEVIKTCVKNGMGVSILSGRAIEKELSDGSLLAVAVPELELKRNFIWCIINTAHYHRWKSGLRLS